MRRLGLLALALAGCSFSAAQTASDDDAMRADAPADTRGDAPTDAPADAPPDCAHCDAYVPPADWWNAAYTHRIVITIDGTKLTGNLTSFPVLVKLASGGPFDFTAALAGGKDLAFIDGAPALGDQTATPLKFDVDESPTAGPWLLWVKVPTLTMGQTHTLALYYGNAAATSTIAPAMTFGDFTSVHHLATTGWKDTTSGNHTGTATGTPTLVGGKLGSGVAFDGTDYLTLADANNNYSFTNNFSVSLWLNAATLANGYEPFVAKGDHTWRVQNGSTSANIGTNDHAQFGTADTSTDYDNLNGTATIDDSTWHHVAIAYSTTAKTLYVDGVQDATEAYSLTLFTNTVPVAFGFNSDASPTRFFTGKLDEVRISATPRSAAWFRAEHDCVTVAGFTTFGSDETIP